MSACPRKLGSYFQENELKSELCQGGGNVWSDELSMAWNKGKANVVAVNAQMDAGGGLVLNKSMLPNLAIEENETLVLTSAHIVDSKTSILVGTYNGAGEMGSQGMDEAQLVALDREKDLALLKVSLSASAGGLLEGIKSDDFSPARAGERALAVLTEDSSRALAVFQVSAVSKYGALGGGAIRRQFPLVTMTDDTSLVVLSTPDLPGTSGSPVISESGKVLGLVSQRLPDTGGNKVHFDKSHRPIWQTAAAVSSNEIESFLQTVDKKAAVR